MTKRYNLRNGERSDNPDSTAVKRKRTTESDDSTNTPELSKLNNYLKIMINEMVETEIEQQVEGILDTVDEHIEVAFNEKLKTTAKQFAKDTMEYIQTSILESCHDMIHSHLDTLDISMSTEQFKQLISEVIQQDFGGLLNKKKPKPSKPGTTKIKLAKAAFSSAHPATPTPPTIVNQQPSTGYPKTFNEDTLKNHTDPMIQKIVNLETSAHNKSVIYREYVNGLTPSGRDKRDVKAKEWLDVAMAMPYSKCMSYPITTSDSNSKVHSFLLDMQHKLDATVHGMKEAKEEIMLEVMKRITNQNCQGKILVLEGPPGIGKTYLSRCISECINVPFESISLGGCRDSSILDGMDYCYVGSHPGAIARALKSLGYANGLLYLDEIDKIGDTPRSQEVSASFLSILDETQNSTFEDNYLFDLKLDLSKLFIIGSVNDSSLINPILRNRMKIVKLPVPTEQDKVDIAKNHFIPTYMKQYSIDENNLVFDDQVIKYILKKTPKEPGVRELKRAIDHIISRFNLLSRTHIQHKHSSKRSAVSDTEPDQHKQLEFSFSIPNFEMPLKLTTSVIDVFMNTMKAEEDNESHKRMYM